MKTRQRYCIGIVVLLALVAPQTSFAQEQAFSDVPPDHPLFEAAQYLQSVGIIAGYADGTFQPDKKVNRAESIKVIIAPLLSEDDLVALRAVDSSFEDVAADVWYKPYVEGARRANIVDGPPDRLAFEGERPVQKAEFMKMVQLAYGDDPHGAFNEITLPLSQDVYDTSAWYYPYLRYGLAASMTMINSEGRLEPGRELTRGQTATLLYRYLMYKQGRRTQALLSEAETELQVILGMLNQQNVVEAEYASVRALLAARGAHLSKPEEPIVRGAVKLSEAFRKLVAAYRAGSEERYDDAVVRSGEAWHLAETARDFTADLNGVSKQVQTIAGQIADSARGFKAEGE